MWPTIVFVSLSPFINVSHWPRPQTKLSECWASAVKSSGSRLQVTSVAFYRATFIGFCASFLLYGCSKLLNTKLCHLIPVRVMKYESCHNPHPSILAANKLKLKYAVRKVSGATCNCSQRFEMFFNCFFPHCIGQLACALFYSPLRFGFGFWVLCFSISFVVFFFLAFGFEDFNRSDA